MSERIEMAAVIPSIAGAIKVDGGRGEGGRVVLDIPGTDLPALLRLTLVRGKVLRVTIDVADEE